jgi:hypothetical protein
MNEGETMRLTGNGYRGNERLRECVVRPVVGKDCADVKRLLFEGLLPGDIGDDASELGDFGPFVPGNTQELCWVAEACGVIVGTIALAEVIRDTVQVRWIRVAKSWQVDHIVARPLVKAAVEYARQEGFLKFIFHVPPELESEVASFLHLLGFEFSRHKLRDGRNALEFYLNLYEKLNRGVPEKSLDQW